MSQGKNYTIWFCGSANIKMMQHDVPSMEDLDGLAFFHSNESRANGQLIKTLEKETSFATKRPP